MSQQQTADNLSASARSTDSGHAGSDARMMPPIQVPGYEFVSKLGTGGYGDVWKAVGPGGFLKAIKILFGQFDGTHAETELKALNRLRDVRHPFLLSIERVEVVDGRVIVVTELADCSLEMRFREARDSGLPGIPREELLGYLRDAADALDFMSNQHALQHLDIKPDNLFIQGQHVKVGDFGLAKSIAMTAASMVDGFTPLYAPPELFEGRPSATSDQYSLAIVYQMMLTGLPPHNGRTAAQLTAQHLRSAPDLSPLHRADRPIVSRALSKNPATRFSGCREFVDELLKRRNAGTVVRVTGLQPSPGRPDNQTHVVDPASIGRSDSHLLKPATPIKPVAPAEQSATVRPLLMIGVGGLGCEIVSALRRRLAPLLVTDVLPPATFICIDSDTESVRQVQSAESPLETSLPELSTVPIPLKSSLSYRKGASEYLNWLSRRWLFNIPRSGNVEGIRPLGRLAMVDHYAELRETLTRALNALPATHAELEGREESDDEEQIPLDVVIVGSTCGGTASGTMLDLALMMREVARKTGRSNVRTCGILLHGTSGSGRQSDVQDANTISFLKELRHYSSPDCEPIRLHPDDHPRTLPRPFDDICLVHLGDDLTGHTLSLEGAKVAEYLFRWLATPARRYLECWRTSNESLNFDGTVRLRTFNAAAFESSTMKAASAAAAELAVHAVAKWLHPHAADVVDDPESPQAQWIEATELSETETVVTRLMQDDSDVWNLVDQLVRSASAAAAEDALRAADRRLVEFLGNLLSTAEEEHGSPAWCLCELRLLVSQSLQQKTRAAAAAARQTTSQLIDESRQLGAGEVFLDACVAAVSDSVRRVDAQRVTIQQSLGRLIPVDAETPPLPLGQTGGLPTLVEQYATLVAALAVCQAVRDALAELQQSLKTWRTERLQPLRQLLQSTLQQIPLAGVRQQLPDSIIASFDRFLRSGERLILTRLPANSSYSAELAVELRKGALEFLMDDFIESQPSQIEDAAEGKAAFPLSASPLLRNVGGSRRVLAFLPDGPDGDSWLERIRRGFGDCVHRCPSQNDRIEALCEVSGFSVEAAIESLSHLKLHMDTLSTQVHSRNDVGWS